ncbi:MAG: iron hydrogenase small subunit [Peptococcaceae bacterium]|nr:iron hydrogenase small subunit [Peptococcaceae bacterium]MBQ2448451.1 iron hydrogenase small subunit [Peptococcaceae bacterium]MBQ5615465.1 iron hydrogenase small subunit [Peptococcaceae bacterium]MBQ5658272.1 iron hydrogenase small subunit [Peptococcaceae bacterium]MBQ5862958.1 iron hydrogenase small subunit [Peptococcaceae bacterium]
MEMVNVIIDGVSVQVEKGSTILQAAQKAGINIPTLCYLKDVNQIGACRVCLVEVKGAKALQPSCVYPVTEGLEVMTNTAKVREARKGVVELLLSNHPADCLNCVRSGNCELQNLAQQMGIRKNRFEGEQSTFPIDERSVAIVRDPNKCVYCRRCEAVCSKVQGVSILGGIGRGFNSTVGPAFGHALDDINCTLCGQCINVCPVGALTEKDDTQKVWNALADDSKHVVVQFSPAVRIAISEEFGLPMGTISTGKLVAALRRMGFNKVFDTNWSADLTIMEEGNELLHRLQNGGTLPMITSCSPGWVKFCENHFPGELDHLSSAKSPQQMFGAMVKTYYPQTDGLNAADIYSVSIMPCTAKKFEAARPEMNSSGYQDVDAVITVREIARMIKQAGIDFANLPDEECDAPMGLGTGAATIFGTTGGVMEAALRTVYEVVVGKELPKLELEEVRGTMGEIKEATIDLNGTPVKVAVVNTLARAKEIMKQVQAGTADYTFIEIMACPNGCVGGGGTPIVDALTRTLLTEDYRALRAKGLYNDDANLPIRKSHENPFIKAAYENFLGEPLGHKAHELLHTHYTARKLYNTECDK